VRRVLYRLPELVKAGIATLVFVVEGEKDVDNLHRLGLVATCNPMGAGKWRQHFNQYLAGRNVVILPDNDKAGRGHAALVARSLQGIAASVKIVQVPAPSKDISEWLASGHTADELLALIAR
jgi:putative DNA primase/helicase